VLLDLVPVRESRLAQRSGLAQVLLQLVPIHSRWRYDGGGPPKGRLYDDATQPC